MALAMQARCVHKVAGAWATHPRAAHRHHPQSQVVWEAMCVLPSVRVLLEQVVMEVWEEGGPQ